MHLSSLWTRVGDRHAIAATNYKTNTITRTPSTTPEAADQHRTAPATHPKPRARHRKAKVALPGTRHKKRAPPRGPPLHQSARARRLILSAPRGSRAAGRSATEPRRRRAGRCASRARFGEMRDMELRFHQRRRPRASRTSVSVFREGPVRPRRAHPRSRPPLSLRRRGLMRVMRAS